MLGSCEMLIVAVGGGGKSRSGPGGSGSGFIKISKFNITRSGSLLEVTVGEQEEMTVVKNSGIVIVEAQPGRAGSGSNGGIDYSGGRSEDAAGGEDGGDGYSRGSYSGGHGSSFNLADISIEAFDLRSIKKS